MKEFQLLKEKEVQSIVKDALNSKIRALATENHKLGTKIEHNKKLIEKYKIYIDSLGGKIKKEESAKLSDKERDEALDRECEELMNQAESNDAMELAEVTQGEPETSDIAKGTPTNQKGKIVLPPYMSTRDYVEKHMDKMPVKEIAENLGLSQARVYQIKESIIVRNEMKRSK